LQSAKDFRALAAYLCAFHNPSDDPLGYHRSVALWSAKSRHAEGILRNAGTEAVDAMLAATS
jgi:hypothetical protein